MFAEAVFFDYIEQLQILSSAPHHDTRYRYDHRENESNDAPHLDFIELELVLAHVPHMHP
jgi:hypothetical protein